IYHAEHIAVEKSLKVINKHEFKFCYLYTTLEPCIMCLFLIKNLGIKRLYYGARIFKYPNLEKDYKAFINFYCLKGIEVYDCIMEKECILLMSNFFKKLR